VVSEVLKYAWTAFWKNWLRLFGVTLLAGILLLLALAVSFAVVGALWHNTNPEAFSDLFSQLQIFNKEKPKIPSTIEYATQFIFYFLISFFAGGFFSAFLAAVRGEPFGVGILFSRMRDFWKYLVAYVIVYAVVILGLLFLILPGIYLAVRLSFYPLAVADGYGPFEAPFKVSWMATRNAFWIVVAFSIVLAGIGLFLFWGLVTNMFVLGGMSILFAAILVFLFVFGEIGFFVYAFTAWAAFYNLLLFVQTTSPSTDQF